MAQTAAHPTHGGHPRLKELWFDGVGAGLQRRRAGNSKTDRTAVSTTTTEIPNWS
jgi:hypothetical protein